jgi:hypothetical protein
MLSSNVSFSGIMSKRVEENMDSNKLLEYVDNQRWLMNCGLFSDSAKNQLFMYGSIVHRDVRAVELDIDVEGKRVSYKIYVDKSLLKKIDKYHELSKATGFWGLRKFKKLLEKEGDLNFTRILNGFIRDYCGPKWSTDVTVLDFADYVEGYGDEAAQGKENSEQDQ